jgi:flagellar assembly protein FliH
MIWSDALTPFTQADHGSGATPMPWSLQELHAEGSEIFRTQSGDVVPTPEESAAAAQAERERAMEEGYAAGYAAGRADAENGFDQRMRSAIDALETAVSLVREGEARYLGTLEENMAAVAVCVARQIIGREVRLAPEITVALVRQALGEFPAGEPLRVRINPLDLSAISLARGEEQDSAARGAEVSWLPDGHIVAGGCVIEGRERILDGRVDAALERAFRRLSNSAA